MLSGVKTVKAQEIGHVNVAAKRCRDRLAFQKKSALIPLGFLVDGRLQKS